MRRVFADIAQPAVTLSPQPTGASPAWYSSRSQRQSVPLQSAMVVSFAGLQQMTISFAAPQWGGGNDAYGRPGCSPPAPMAAART